MSSTGGPGQAGPPQSAPYAPRYIGLGGRPAIIPDIPITSAFLVFYLIFAVIHIKIMKYNKHRGHKFIFNGALFGFCKVRLITMSLRIAWACYPTNVSLGIAAQVFVYVGTIILYLCNWFFVQRVIRAQHPHIGWSTPYRIFHRGGMIALILALLMIIVASIQQFFTLDFTILRVDRDLQLAAFTFFGAFTLAPLFMLLVSFVIPREATEKFGAGRLRNAIGVLFIGSFILALGQCFRTITGWLPEVPLRNDQGQPNAVPWYFSKACFYVFNFLTELLVVIFYAVMRVDLRFYVPDGAKKPGDYRAYRQSQFNVDVIGNEKRLKRQSGPAASVNTVASNETLHEYDASIFEDTRTLADSLRFQSSVMEIDDKTGNWKVKRPSMSNNGSIRSSSRPSSRSQSSLWDPTRATLLSELAPPVPLLPQSADWPLRGSRMPLGQHPVKQQRVRSSSSPNQSSHLIYANFASTPDIEKSDAIDMASRKLEGNAPPDYSFVVLPAPMPTYHPSFDVPQKHTYAPASSTPDILSKRDYTPTPFTLAAFDLPAKKDCSAPVADALPQGQTSSTYSEANKTSINTEAAESEFVRFSFEASPRNRSFEDERKAPRRFL
ncbi:uncharacterized protein CC84DRAFT_556032 [Paraphaeosphaeria sporulosa]|uniref:Uncharacterized protein n=1 Tax=Paraphaeosphaeria sporulosa TaxID=1460663 RepID=A0A177CKV1_9PLEO|nr:uncharacterized protein CC84DRAFT_556032 [Paraphaeosphaeria sporulosa]OAG08133.1 hypothetical protein CC84DRAFT_556032 [Paraphaeosphaeria sporulosa]